MLKIWGRRSAFNVQKVLWTLGECSLPHEQMDIGGSFGGLDDPGFLAMNPNGRIPVVVDGKTVIWESHSIIRYVAAKQAPGSLWPKSPAARSRADRWMDWMLASLQPAFMDLFWSYFRTPEAERDQSAVQEAMARCVRHFGVLEKVLSDQPFLAGRRFTMGDIPAGTALYRWYGMGLSVPKLPAVREWYERLTRRSAYREHVMVPFEELRGKRSY